jgi:thioredoxin-related protein
MKTLIRSFALVAASGALAFAGEWSHDWDAAKAKAKELDRPILINFTGSDWCGWCIKLEKEVFSKEAFQSYADENLVLMEVDFPRKKELPEDVRKQNDKLDKAYDVEGYPTVYLLNAEGEKIGPEIGYREGGAEAYVAHLKQLLAAAESERG